MAKKAGKIGQTWTYLNIFSQATGQTWHHTSAYHITYLPLTALLELSVSAISNFFNNFSVCHSLLTGVILPLFKGKGAKANNKGVLLSSLLFAKFTRWSSSIVWENLRNSRDSFQICNSASKKGLVVLKPLLLFWNP